MKINLSPVRQDEKLEVSVAGATLSINGEAFDFSRMVDGDTLPATAMTSPWFTGQVDNVGGELELTLILPLPANYSPEQAFPEPLLITADGPVALPQPLPPAEELQAVTSEIEEPQA